MQVESKITPKNGLALNRRKNIYPQKQCDKVSEGEDHFLGSGRKDAHDPVLALLGAK